MGSWEFIQCQEENIVLGGERKGFREILSSFLCSITFPSYTIGGNRNEQSIVLLKLSAKKKVLQAGQLRSSMKSFSLLV